MENSQNPTENTTLIQGKTFENIMSFVFSSPAAIKTWEQPIDFFGQTLRLHQHAEGPCGLFSVLQAYIIMNHHKNPKKTPEQLLYDSAADIMFKIRKCYAFCQFIDLENKVMQISLMKNREDAIQYMEKSDYLVQKNSVFLLAISFVYLTGPALLNSYAVPEPFIGDNGYASVQFVLLLITGMIADSASDDFMVYSSFLFSGVCFSQDIGMLYADRDSIEEREIGKYLMFPKEDIWIIYYGGHFNTIAYEKDKNFYEYNNLSTSDDAATLCSKKHVLYDTLYSIILEKPSK